MPSTALALVALGSNMGDSVQIVRRAMDRLQEFSEQPLLRSSLWESAPIDCPPGSANFINAAVALVPRADQTPEALLERLQHLEREFGRRPKAVLNQPRPLDLDLIAFGAEIRNTPELTLPHPRAHLRRFVLEPLNEIVPDFVFPTLGRSISDLLEAQPGAASVRRIA